MGVVATPTDTVRQTVTSRAASNAAFPGAIDSILNGLPALIGYWDADLRNRLANNAYVEYFGMTPEQIHGRHIREVLGEELYAKNLPFLERALAGERQMFDREIPTPSGEKRYTQASYIPDVVDGEVRGIFVLVTDISQRRNAEIEAQEARLAAQAANRAKTEFLARVSHEFRTPLTSLLGFINLMRIEDDLSPAALDDLAYIERSARQLSSLVEDLLDSASLASGRLSLKPRAVALDGVLEEAIALVRPLAAERGITLELSATANGPAPIVWADPDRLKQIALNLLSNGIKYGPRHDRIHVRPSTIGDMVCVRFADNGTPLTHDQCEAIFEPMVRLGGSTETGTGLGLPLSRSLAEAMAGSLTVEPGTSQGNTFVLTLPATATRPEGSAGDGEPAASTRALRLNAELSRLLYVENNLDSLGLVSAMLSRFADVEVIPASQGHMAIDLARVQLPDAIILDTDLPDIGVRELVRLLRSDERTRDIPIIATGASISPELNADLEASGVVAVLAKPFTIEDLFGALSQLPSAQPATG